MLGQSGGKAANQEGTLRLRMLLEESRQGSKSNRQTDASVVTLPRGI